MNNSINMIVSASFNDKGVSKKAKNREYRQSSEAKAKKWENFQKWYQANKEIKRKDNKIKSQNESLKRKEQNKVIINQIDDKQMINNALTNLEVDQINSLKKKYFKNNKQGIVNQGAVWNKGCFTETNIWHILKEMLGNRTYNIFIYIKIVIFKCNKINLET